MGLKVWSNLGPTNQISKSPFSDDFLKNMPKVKSIVDPHIFREGGRIQKVALKLLKI